MKRATLTGSNRYHSWARTLPGRTGSIWWWTLFSLITVSWIVTTPTHLSAAQKYYYIHVSSFRTKENATKVARDLQQKGYRSVVSGERVQNKGYWYRIYVGPISTLQQAKLQSSELKKKGLTNYTAIYKKSLIRDDSGKTVRTAKKAAPVATATAGIKLSQPSKTAPSVGKKPPTIQSSQQRVEAAKKAPPTVSPTEERPTETSELQRRGYGRNISAGKLSLSLRQTYREVNTELTDRTQIESDGTTTNNPISSSEKNDFDTDMNLSMLRFGLGLTDYLEVFGEIGACYDDFEDFNLAYGGGARLNLFEIKNGTLRGLYTALEADYHKGKLETEYQSIAGNRFSKDADWWDFTGKGELGFTRNRFAVYVGGTYFVYREDTDRKRLGSIPAGPTPVKFEDDLEEENNFGAYGGLSLSLTPGLLINVEGQVYTQSSITGAIEYRF
ncbi:MAG: SPOR domain-containing protein [Proteobacteria bacterium]|nr:SPOR domain-containing protein [Pseudomonadota bacterium]